MRRQTYGYLPSLSWYLLHLSKEGWPGGVDLGGWLHTEIVYPPKTVTHPGTNRAQCRVTTLIETKALPLSQTANRTRMAIVLVPAHPNFPQNEFVVVVVSLVFNSSTIVTDGAVDGDGHMPHVLSAE